ncbi:MAG: hypothetical protein NVS3B12_33420 [Acidimicrobiales bacterium]
MARVLDRMSTGPSLPAYRALAEQLRRDIREQRYAEGQRLPTEAELSDGLGLSRQTVRRAFQDLVAEGTVYRVPGRGTFVRPDAGKYLRPSGSIEDLMTIVEDTELEVLRPPALGVDIEAAGRLRLDTDEVVSITFRRFHDDQPFCVTTAYLPPPVVIAGGGFVTGRPDDRDAAVTSLRRVVAQGHIPVLTTYKGRGVVADSAEYCAGVATGATIEASVLEDADLIIGVGLDPVELIPGAWTYGADVVLLGRWQIDDSTFFGARLVAEVVGELDHLINTFVAGLATEWTPGTGARHRQDAADALTAAVPTAANGLTPQQVVTIARRVAPPGTIATVDAGAHMLVAVPLWGTERPGELLVSSGLATMGYALPAAAAAALVHPDRRVICFTGDGGLGMVLAELETLARLGLRVTVVVFNDATLSLIAIKQRAEGHGGEDAVRYAPMDFAAIGAACGLASARVVDASGYEAAMRAALAHEGPTIVDVTVDPSAYSVIDAIRGARRSLSS